MHSALHATWSHIFIFARLIKTGMVSCARTHVGNKIASSPLIGTTTSVCTRCVAFDWIAFRQPVSRVRRHVRAKCRINLRQSYEGIGEGIGRLKSRSDHDFERRELSGEEWELNKCLPAEICVPIFETPEFPRTAK